MRSSRLWGRNHKPPFFSKISFPLPSPFYVSWAFRRLLLPWAELLVPEPCLIPLIHSCSPSLAPKKGQQLSLHFLSQMPQHGVLPLQLTCEVLAMPQRARSHLLAWGVMGMTGGRGRVHQEDSELFWGQEPRQLRSPWSPGEHQVPPIPGVWVQGSSGNLCLPQLGLGCPTYC